MTAPVSSSYTSFVLGSSSPRRKDLLQQIGYTPDLIVGADIDETPQPQETPRAYCVRMAVEKNAALTPQYPDSLILTADTMIALGRRIIGKPTDRADAERIIRLLSGRAHRVYSAVTVSVPHHAPVTRLSISRVTLKRLDEQEITGFLDTLEWQGVSGGYRLQGAMAQFMISVQGSPSGIIGLPLFETAQILKGLGSTRNRYGSAT
jgi:septum formation protein